jgi:hypothetical protein
MILFVDALLFFIAAVLALIAATRGRVVLRDSAREGVLDFFKLMPRIMLGGFLTPGGPVIGFSIGTAALKGGAGAPQVIAYTTAWALFAIQRLFIWELGVMPHKLVWLRIAASWPLPILAALGAMLLGRP